ncbi:NfeD family protein [Yunchengibacter salinarum]|uniref:NfeD family protein n=1 Tax=Yunchengibacter salinarum TaxID=3133399 RepID=UPI0035B5DFE0
MAAQNDRPSGEQSRNAPQQADLASTAPGVRLIAIDGPIGPGRAAFVIRALKAAEADPAIGTVILRLDTPGGLMEPMRAIVQAVLNSTKPVIGHVAPPGGRAASAGTFILMATHMAAMAPNTTIGAAAPVAVGSGGGGTGDDEADDTSGKAARPDLPDKVMNDAAATMRGLARARGRPAPLAERFVTEALSLNTHEAMEKGVVALTAADTPSLLAALNGRTITLGANGKGRAVRLDTSGPVSTAAPTWRDDLLAFVTNPNVAYLLMLVGIYGLFLEFSNPGMIFPGVAGGVALLLALYAFQMLPINVAGAGLILLGIALMALEAVVTSLGVLAIGGIVAFVLGSILLMDTNAPGFALSYWLIGSAALVAAASSLLVVSLAVRAWRRPITAGGEALLDRRATVEHWNDDGTGTVHVRGENWSATGPAELSPGDSVRITERRGLVLRVTPWKQASKDTPDPRKET